MSPTVINGKAQTKPLASIWINASGPGRSLTAAQYIRTDHEVSVRIDAFSRTNQRIPPTRLPVIYHSASPLRGVAGQSMANKDRVVSTFIQRPVRFIGNSQRPHFRPGRQPQSTLHRQTASRTESARLQRYSARTELDSLVVDMAIAYGSI